VIRIEITAEAFDAVVKTLPLGTVAYEPEVSANGLRQIWLDPRALDRLDEVRQPDESYSDVILRLARVEGGAKRFSRKSTRQEFRGAFAALRKPPKTPEKMITAKKAFEPRVGAKLPNGATVLSVLTKADGRRYVLADDGGAEPYVTWQVDDRGDAFGGRAFSDLTVAGQDLVER
jgi:hypothetical protein